MAFELVQAHTNSTWWLQICGSACKAAYSKCPKANAACNVTEADNPYCSKGETDCFASAQIIPAKFPAALAAALGYSTGGAPSVTATTAADASTLVSSMTVVVALLGAVFAAL